MVQITPLAEVAGILQRSRALDQRDTQLGEQAKRSAALQQREDTRLKMVQDREALSRQTMSLDVLGQAMGQGYERFQAMLPLLEQTGLYDEEDIAAFQAIPKEGFPQAVSKLNAATEHFNSITEGFTPEERLQAQKVEAGISPMAVGNANTTIAMGGTGIPSAEAVADVAGTIKSGEEAGKQAIEQSGDMFDQLATINSSVRSYDEAISAIDAGASSGRIANMFPSIRQSSIELDNAGRRLGLDIISMGKFGPLSEGEMKLAMETALPPLKGDALKEWLLAKKDAQVALSEELRKAAVFLGKPGSTLADFLEMQEIFSDEPKEEEDEPSVTVIEYDNQGNLVADPR